jgi:hypothetical protein
VRECEQDWESGYARRSKCGRDSVLVRAESKSDVSSRVLIT